jgi:hypothetical protein
MTSKKLSMAVGVLALMGLSAPALAADPVQISCPAGSIQQLVNQQDVACVNQDGSRAAGPVVMLYPSGQKMAEGQVDARGFRTGTWTLYSEAGMKTHVIQFSRGNFDGQRIEFHPNGQPKTVEQYQKGIRVGQPQQFDVAGNPVLAR